MVLRQLPREHPSIAIPRRPFVFTQHGTIQTNTNGIRVPAPGLLSSARALARPTERGPLVEWDEIPAQHTFSFLKNKTNYLFLDVQPRVFLFLLSVYSFSSPTQLSLPSPERGCTGSAL